MQEWIKSKSVLGIFLLASLSACSEGNDLSEQLWYRQPAADWFEALPLGNGRLGAMVFGGVSQERNNNTIESL